MAKLGKQQELECRLLDMLKEVVGEVRKEYPEIGYFNLSMLQDGHYKVYASKNTDELDPPILDAWETKDMMRMSYAPVPGKGVYSFIPGYGPFDVAKTEEPSPRLGD